MAIPTLTMQAPAPVYTTLFGRSGTIYHSSATGLIPNVLASDVVDLITGGYTIVGPGYGQFHVRLGDGRNLDGSALAAAAATGKFGQTITLGTTSSLVSEAANASTINDSAIWEVTLPASFPAGTNPKIMANGAHVIGIGTLGAHTLAMHLYKVNDDGTQSADLVTTAAQNTLAVAGDTEFDTNTGGVLNPGDRVMLEAIAHIVETGTHAVTFNLNSLRFA